MMRSDCRSPRNLSSIRTFRGAPETCRGEDCRSKSLGRLTPKWLPLAQKWKKLLPLACASRKQTTTRTSLLSRCYKAYQNNVPFLARNFGTFGAELTYDLFDGGKRRASVKESDAKLAQAKENLARISDDVEVQVESALNRLNRTKEMVDVAEQLLTLRSESSRVTAQQLLRGEALQSQARRRSGSRA